MRYTERTVALAEFSWETEVNDEYPQDHLSQDHDAGSGPYNAKMWSSILSWLTVTVISSTEKTRAWMWLQFSYKERRQVAAILSVKHWLSNNDVSRTVLRILTRRRRWNCFLPLRAVSWCNLCNLALPNTFEYLPLRSWSSYSCIFTATETVTPSCHVTLR
jgi:hypothetical protein